MEDSFLHRPNLLLIQSGLCISKDLAEECFVTGIL
jgi:hypothetical protein